MLLTLAKKNTLIGRKEVQLRNKCVADGRGTKTKNVAKSGRPTKTITGKKRIGKIGIEIGTEVEIEKETEKGIESAIETETEIEIAVMWGEMGEGQWRNADNQLDRTTVQLL